MFCCYRFGQLEHFSFSFKLPTLHELSITIPHRIELDCKLIIVTCLLVCIIKKVYTRNVDELLP